MLKANDLAYLREDMVTRKVIVLNIFTPSIAKVQYINGELENTTKLVNTKFLSAL